MPIVPNKFPSIVDYQGRRLAIVGESPGKDEEDHKRETPTGYIDDPQPFVGASGRLLRMVLAQAGITPEACFFGNICQHRPPDNDITQFDWNGPEIQAGISRLKSDLDQFKPNCVLSLGRTAFRLFNPERCYPCKVTKDNPDGIKIPIFDWRGSPFVSSWNGTKVIPSIHPAYVLRVAADIAYFRADIARAVRHSSSPTLNLPVRSGILRPTLQDVVEFLTDLVSTRRPAAFDIEGYTDGIGVTMLSICPTPTSGIVIPFYVDGRNYWNEEEEAIVWGLLSQWLASPHCPKIAHNAFYETLVLAWRHNIVIDGIVGDTMMKHWEIYNELEKSLGVCTSIWIEEPYYKDERESSGDRKLHYNFKDSACTKGIDESMEGPLNERPGPAAHYAFNVALIPPYTYMHLRGCRFDGVRAAAHLKKATDEHDSLIAKIDGAVGPALEAAGYERPFNVKSVDHKEWFLYDHLQLEPYKRYGRTTKEEILHRFYKKTKNETLQQIIQAVALRTRMSDIEKLTPNADGRIRTSYDLVSTVTARLNSRESSITEHVGFVKSGPRKGAPVYAEFGTNLQNVTKPIRDVFITDGPDYLMFQADLEGADAWTVAADLSAKGDPRMLDDLLAGVKPSKLLLRMLEEIEAGRDPSLIARMDSVAAKAECDKIIVPEGTLDDGRPADWKYTCMKRVQHGSNYLGQEETIAATIFKDSDGRIDVPPFQIAQYQRLYFLRYNIDSRKEYIRETLQRTGRLQTAAGVNRKFFGIRNPRMIDDDIIRQAMASEPQTNTTYATNLALRRMWNDPSNRRKSGALFIEPLLQIHDALAGQFPVRLRDFARSKLREWFDNELVINGIKVRIPVDIKVGPSWGDCKQKI